MANEELRKQIIIEMRSDAQGVADRAADEVRRLKQEIGGLSDAFGEGRVESDEFKSNLTSLSSQVKFWSDTVKTATAALIESDPENARYQAALQAMATDTARATQAEAARRDGLRAGLAAVRDTTDAIDRENDAERRHQAELERTLVPLAKLQMAGIKYGDSLERSAAQAVAAASQVVGGMVIQEAEHAKLLHAEMDDAVAKRMLANATAGAAREQDHLNQVIRAGIGEMMEEQAAATGAGASIAAGGAASGAAQSRYGNLTFSILSAGHAFQDLTSAGNDWQRGLASTLNNIPLLVTGFATASGVAYTTAMAWAGGLTIVASSAMVLYQNWDNLKNAMGVGIPRPVLDSTAALSAELKKASGEFEELEKKTRLSLGELGRFKELNQQILDIKKKQREESETAALKDIESDETTKTGSGVKKAIGESGGYDSFVGTVEQAIQNESDRLGLKTAWEAIQKEAEGLARDAAGGDKNARNRIKDVVKENLPDGGMNPVYENLTKFSPEYDRLSEQEKEEGEKTRKGAERKAKSEKDWEESVRWQNQYDAAEEKRQQTEAEQEKEKAIQTLMGGKAKPLGPEFEGKTNAMAAKGKTREAIQSTLAPELAARLTKQGADQGIAPEAARRLVVGMIEKAFGNIAAQGDVPAPVGAMMIDAAEKSPDAPANVKARTRKAKKQVADRRNMIGRALQHDLNMSPEEASHAAPTVDRKIQQGMPPRMAAQSTAAEMQRHFQQQATVILEMQAQQEQMLGMIGQATMQLQAMRQTNSNIRRGMKQAGRPSFLQPFTQF